ITCVWSPRSPPASRSSDVQLAGRQTVSGVHGIVLFKGLPGLVLELFELAGQSHTRRCIAYAQLLERAQTGFYSHRRNHFEQFLAHAAVHGCTTESDAILSAVIELALAEIARMGAASSPVTNMELAATVSA